MIKAVFFDVDGTLISHNQKGIPKSTIEALDKLAEKGIRRVLATGRHTVELAMLPVNDIAFDGYITLNGQLCLDGQKNVISGTPIDGKEKEMILQLFRERTLPVVLVEKDRFYINFINHEVELAQESISTPLPDVDEYSGNEIYQAVVYLEDERALVEQLPNCKITRWAKFGVDVIAASGGKTEGIKEYLQLNQLKREETMAFGDGENDIEMLQYVQIGVAMGNADDEVKQNADYVAASIDDDGLMKALVEFKVIE